MNDHPKFGYSRAIEWVNSEEITIRNNMYMCLFSWWFPHRYNVANRKMLLWEEDRANAHSAMGNVCATSFIWKLPVFRYVSSSEGPYTIALEGGCRTASCACKFASACAPNSLYVMTQPVDIINSQLSMPLRNPCICSRPNRALRTRRINTQLYCCSVQYSRRNSSFE